MRRRVLFQKLRAKRPAPEPPLKQRTSGGARPLAIICHRTRDRYRQRSLIAVAMCQRGCLSASRGSLSSWATPGLEGLIPSELLPPVQCWPSSEETVSDQLNAFATKAPSLDALELSP